MSGKLRKLLILTDISFLLYWFVTYFQLIPSRYAYQDYTDEMLVIWNWSFFPLDVLISITGLLSLYYYRKSGALWRPLVLISLVLTSCSGLQAISFWVIKQDYDLMWWIPNLFLLIYPLFFIPGLVRSGFKGTRFSSFD